jgi:hypothetical protein
VKAFARANTAITIFKFLIPGLTILGLMLSSFHWKTSARRRMRASRRTAGRQC